MSDARTILAAGSTPRLPRHIKMRHDAARDRWVILAPERIFTPDAIAVAVLQLCDGDRSVEAIAHALAEIYSARPEHILSDILVMLQDLADKGVVTV